MTKDIKPKLNYYFTHPTKLNAVAKIVTDMDVKELIRQGILKTSDKYLTYPEDTILFQDDPKEVLLEFYEFDDPINPKNIIINFSLLEIKWMNILRARRDRILSVLDNLAIRALGSQNQIALKKIEDDKVRLRTMTDRLDFSGVKTISDVYNIFPPELSMVYEGKTYGL